MFGNLTALDIGFFFVAVLLSMSIHEAMHAFTSHWLGDTTARDTGRLTLNPLKHIDSLTTVLLPVVMIIAGLFPIFAAKPVPFNPERVRHGEYGIALIGIAGPLTNLVLAILAAILFHGLGVQPGGGLYAVMIIFVQVNIALFIFNMIPFPPLDGSRLLYAFAPEPLQALMRQIESFGFIAILIFILIAFQFLIGPIINVENFFLTLLLG